MNSKTENVIVNDCNTIANGIMRDINDIDAMERMLSSELSSEDLFRIDCAILTSLRDTTLHNALAEIQKDTIIDVTIPLQNMFDEMINYVSEAFV